MTITGAQLKAARELVELSQSALAVILGCGTAEIASFEVGVGSIDRGRLAHLTRAFEAAGVEFSTGESGARLRAREWAPRL